MNAYEMREGDRLSVFRQEGYRLEQERPMDCRTFGEFPDGSYGYGCKCGQCNGRQAEYPGTITRIINWADGAIEAIVACDDGEERRRELRACHPDP